jgi:ferredoxin-NADP reductase
LHPNNLAEGRVGLQMTLITETRVREHEDTLVVRSRDVVAEDVVALTLAAPDGSALPAWTPGAHVDLLLADDLTRQYSLCGNVGDRSRWRVAVLRSPDSAGGSRQVHEHLTEGAAVGVRGPRNHFPLVAAPRYLFVAGGIGITPMLPMLAEAEAAGADWHLYYGGRNRSSMAFLDELARHGDKVTVVPQDEAGMLDLGAILGSPRDGTLVYCCGPEGLLGAVETGCQGWPPGTLHLERFAAKTARAPEGTETGFDVVLQRSGITLTVGPDESVFDAVRAAGVSVLGSCQQGVCGTCETGVIDGDVDHRDSVLSAEEQEENEYMMICVSRCRGERLTLDL